MTRAGLRIAAIAMICTGLGALAVNAAPGIKDEAPAAPVVSGRLGPPEAVADGVWVMRQPDRVWAAVIGNVGIIEQTDGVVLFDSGGTIADGRDIVAAVRTLTPKPIKAVVISHWHNDHPLGVPGIQEAFPNVRVIATASAAEALKTRPGVGVGRPDEQREIESQRNIAARVQLYAEAAEDPKLSADMRRNYAIEGPWVRDRGQRQLGSFVVLPTETFTDRLALPDPVRPVEIIFAGEGNTQGDAIAWLPRQRTVLTGDIVVLPTPYGFNVSVKPWLETLSRIEELNYATLVPGHGKVQRDQSYMRTLRWSMTDIWDKAKSAAESGITEDQAWQRFDKTAHEKRFGVTSDWDKHWLETYWLVGMFRTAFKEARGEKPNAG